MKEKVKSVSFVTQSETGLANDVSNDLDEDTLGA